MNITATLQGSFIVIVSGLPGALGDKRFWRGPLEEYGRRLQERIAESFASERVAGSSTLAANSPEYNAQKARDGYDSRRGHRTNFLQSVLDGAPLFRIGPITFNRQGVGRVRIDFVESWLHARVPYAEYYEAAKVRRAGILALARTWVTAELAPLQRAAAQEALRARRAAERSRIRNRGGALPAIGAARILRPRFRA